MSDEIIIDGSLGEGGGQMLRTSLAFSAIAGRPVTIKNIRANRPKPGLAGQHLAGLNLMGQVCRAEVRGGEIGSRRVEFQPGQIKHGQYQVDIGTAGSVTLALQTILPALATIEGESIIQLTGGTDVKWSPPADYYNLVLFPLLEKMGLKCSLEIEQRGYFPRGGGKITARINSAGKLLPLKLEPINEPKITGIVNITGLPMKIAERIRNSAFEILPDADIRIQYTENGPGQGVGIVLAAADGQTIMGGNSLGERGKPAERLGKEAAKNLLAGIEGGGSVDIYASDQLLPYLAMAGGCITARKFTGHAGTNIHTIEKIHREQIELLEGRVVKFTSRI